jgi:hypothetical protein
VLSVLVSACAGDKYFDQLMAQSSALRGYIVVAGSTTINTAPGTIALFDTNGTLVRQLRDHYTDVEVTTGLAVFNNLIFALIDGSDRIESISPFTSDYANFNSNPNVTGTFRKMTVDSSGYLYILESNTGTGSRGQIEKVDPNGQRVGSPFINTDTGTTPACALQTPLGIEYLPTTNQIVVTNNAGNLLFYNASTGACALSVNNASFTAGNPYGVVYHAPTNKLLMAKIGTDTIIASSITGTGPITVYNNTTRVLDPYAIAVDADGFVYVGAAGQDTIEKFTFDGTTMTPVSSGPLIQSGIYTQNPAAIAVFR